MKELKEVNFDNDIILNDNLVKGAILPKTVAELDRNVIIQGNSIVEGAVYAHKLEILKGGVEICGSVYTKLELHVDSAAKGNITFRKAVASSDSIVSLTNGVRMYFLADVNAKSVKLSNTFIAGSLFADEAVLENCVILGGAFATKKLFLKNCIVGTFNAPSVSVQENTHLLLPSAFSVEELRKVGDARMYNLSLADLGGIYTGNEQLSESGVIEMDINSEELKSVLTADDNQVLMRTYSVVGKVLAADLIDTDKLNNHFLLTATSLGNQLLQTYSLHDDKNNTLIDIVPEKVADMFFDIISGKTTVQPLSGNFSIEDIVSKFS